MENATVITIFVRERETKNGVKFNAYTYRNSEGEFFNVKFTKNTKNVPDIKGYVKIKFNYEDSNIKFDADNRGTIYINDVIEFERDEVATEEAKQRSIEKMRTFFN